VSSWRGAKQPTFQDLLTRFWKLSLQPGSEWQPINLISNP
jgi:hypothetical protein